jgi:hypothetical protein
MVNNEGKACDAVLRELERRIGTARHSLIFPAEPAHPPHEQVEVIGFVGSQKYALEHTYSEPFEGYRDLEFQVGPFNQKLVESLKGELDPAASFDLTIPIRALSGRGPRELAQLRGAIANWVVETAPHLAHDPQDRAPDFAREATADIPFKIFLRRRDLMHFPPRFQVYSLVPLDTEKLRRKRLREAYWRKASKLLAVKKAHCARTVLILEEDDIRGTNQWLVASAVRCIEKGRLAERPDEVYLLSTVVKTWCIYPIRVDGRWLYGKGELSGRYRELDPKKLVDITTLGRAGRLNV